MEFFFQLSWKRETRLFGIGWWLRRFDKFFELRRWGGWLVPSAPGFWGKGPGFESAIYLPQWSWWAAGSLCKKVEKKPTPGAKQICLKHYFLCVCRSRIEAAWEAKGAGTSKWMYNASKFRLADFSLPEEQSGANTTKLLLQVGITDYKDLQVALWRNLPGHIFLKLFFEIRKQKNRSLTFSKIFILTIFQNTVTGTYLIANNFRIIFEEKNAGNFFLTFSYHENSTTF